MNLKINNKIIVIKPVSLFKNENMKVPLSTGRHNWYLLPLTPTYELRIHLWETDDDTVGFYLEQCLFLSRGCFYNDT